MTDVERMAYKALAGFKQGTVPMLGEPMVAVKYAVETLSVAGLLVTPLHKRALEALKAYTTAWERTHHELGMYKERNEPWERMVAVGREALAAEKPEGRYFVGLLKDRDGLWMVQDGALAVAKFSSESDARAYVAQKNREESQQ